MSTLRVIAGRYKGRSIPFPARKFSEAEVTPQKVKGAVFSLLGEDLTGRSFLDLFAGSGQIAVEALSRGAEPVVTNELDRIRFQALRSFLSDIGAGVQFLCLNMPALRALDYLASRHAVFDVIYMDPPYDKSRGQVSPYDSLLEATAGRGLLSESGLVIIQHHPRSPMTERICGLALEDQKKYGNTSLSVYRRE